MTVNYSAAVATSTGFSIFMKLLLRWRGSIWKLLWPNLLVFSVSYLCLSALYRLYLTPNQRENFEQIVLYTQSYSDLIPVTFVLSFYINVIVARWWSQWIEIPWPDNVATFVSTCVHGQDDRGRLMRRTILRYINLSLVITFTMMSPQVKKRFPTWDHMIEAGFLQETEKRIFEDLNLKTMQPKYWMPCVWACGIITRARKEGRVRDDYAMQQLIVEVAKFRGGLGMILNYDMVPIPLVYTQVVTLAVYMHFLATLMAQQYLDPSKGYKRHEIDLYFPFFAFLQIFFYLGWLKVAESLINPFGEDDDDFDINWLVDRNIQMSYLIVDEMHQDHPELVKDQYWDDVFPTELPYTVAAEKFKGEIPMGSTAAVEVSADKMEFVPMEVIVEDPDVENPQKRMDSVTEIEIPDFLFREEEAKVLPVVKHQINEVGTKPRILNIFWI